MHLRTRMPVIASHEATMTSLGKVHAANSSGNSFASANTVSLTLPIVNQDTGNTKDAKSKPNGNKTGNRVKIRYGSKHGELRPDSDVMELSDTTLLSPSDVALALEGSSSSLLNSNPKTAPHMAVYDRLLRDMEIKRLSQFQQIADPRNSLPALPRRPVRKKWGLSAPYSAFYLEKSSYYHQPMMEQHNQYHQQTYPTPRTTPRYPQTEKDVRHQKRDFLKHSMSEPARSVKSVASPIPGSYEIPVIDSSFSRPISILSKSYTQWGSGFRAPTRNDYYEEEMKRQRVLTAMLPISEPNFRETTDTSPTNSETSPQNLSVNLSEHKKFLTFCHSASFEERLINSNRDFPRKKVRQKPLRDVGTDFIKVTKERRNWKTS